MASTYLTRTPGTPTLSTKFTFSAWIKRSFIGNADNTLLAKWDTGDDRGHINFTDTPDDAIQLFEKVSNVTTVHLVTNRLFRDTSAWYHVVYEADSTQATASDRLKLYINGVQETSFGTSTYPSQNYNWQIQALTDNFEIGGLNAGSSLFDGSMSHVHFIDGTAYDATAFGSTDANGVWKINTSPSVTYGTNGFFILKDGNSVTDQSGNSNNFTVGGGTLTNTEDNPSNVFATMNPLDNQSAGGTFSNGNNTVTSVNAGYTYNTSTLGVNTGKFYWECKWSAQPTGSSNQVLIGIAKRPAPSSTTWLGSVAYTYGYLGSDGHVKVSDSNATGSSATTYAVGDIISVALDLDNNKLHFAKNGSWTNSSNPSANTGGVTITAPDSTTGDSGFYFAGFGDGNISLQETGQFNFGNGYFGTTAVSSAGTNASGIGIFEYDVPTGYTALSTKGLNE